MACCCGYPRLRQGSLVVRIQEGEEAHAVRYKADDIPVLPDRSPAHSPDLATGSHSVLRTVLSGSRRPLCEQGGCPTVCAGSTWCPVRLQVRIRALGVRNCGTAGILHRLSGVAAQGHLIDYLLHAAGPRGNVLRLGTQRFGLHEAAQRHHACTQMVVVIAWFRQIWAPARPTPSRTFRLEFAHAPGTTVVFAVRRLLCVCADATAPQPITAASVTPFNNPKAAPWFKRRYMLSSKCPFEAGSFSPHPVLLQDSDFSGKLRFQARIMCPHPQSRRTQQIRCSAIGFHIAQRFDLHSFRKYTWNAGWSSPVARWAHNPKVVGSNPTPATI